jgi:hypothetical protein
VGTPYEIPYALRSRGSSDAVNTRLTITLLSTAIAVEAADAACAPLDPMTYQCELGTIAAGDVRIVRLRVFGTRAANADISAIADSDADGYTANNTAGVQLRFEHAVDLAVVLASGGAGLEDSAIDGQVTVRSNGRQALSSGELDVDLNAAGTLESASLHNGAACTLLTAQRARCPLPAMTRGAQVYVDYQARFAEPGNYDVTFTARATGDSAPDNDVLQRPVIVRPFNDIAVSGDLGFTNLLVGETRSGTFTVTADRRSLAAARLIAPNYLPGLRVVDIHASAGDCRVDPDNGGICDFTDLGANTSVSVTVTWRAEESAGSVNVSVGVSTTGDVASANNAVRGSVETHGMTDLELRVGAPVSGFRNTTVAFPEISVVNGNEKAFDTRLDVTLPPGATLVSISAANALCSGTGILRCDFAELEPGSVSTVNISVRVTEAGALTSQLKLSASNDGNTANDAKDAGLTISNASNAAQTAGGGKGGGRLEWLALVFLGAVCARRLFVA